MKKRALSLLLAAMMVISLLPTVAFATDLPTGATGWIVDEGDNHVWYKLEESNTKLTIGGTGAMPNFADASEQPWKDNRNGIRSVVIESGVTSVGNHAFDGFGSDSAVLLTLPDGWQGDLPDEGGNWYGAKAELYNYGLKTVKNVKLQQRYPWDGIVYITADVMGSGVLPVSFNIYYEDGETWVQISSPQYQGDSDVELTSGMPQQVEFHWDANTGLTGTGSAVKAEVVLDGEFVSTSSAVTVYRTANDLVVRGGEKVQIEVNPAWTVANMATVSIEGEDSNRTYGVATIDTWDTTGLTPGKYELSYSEYNAKATFWVTDDNWVVRNENITADYTFESTKTYLVLGTVTVADGQNLKVEDGAKFFYGTDSCFKGGTLSELPKKYEKSVSGDLFRIIEKELGTEDNPWNVGTEGHESEINAYVTQNVTGKVLHITGGGMIGSLANISDATKDAVEAIIVEDKAVTDAAINVFNGFKNVSLTLPDGWQGDLPDGDANWYGAQGVELSSYPNTVRNVTFQQRYPWNGKVDITTEISGAGEQNISVSAFKKVSSSWEQISVSAIQGTTKIDLGYGDNVLLQLIWNAAEDLKNEELNTIKVEVTLGGKVSKTSIEGTVDLRNRIELPEATTTIGGVTWGDLTWGLQRTGITVGWENTETSEAGIIANGLSGNGKREVNLPPKNGTYRLTFSGGSEEFKSLATYVVTGFPVYLITNGTIALDAHGTISINKISAAAYETVSVTVNPDSNYMLKGLTVSKTDDEGTTISAVKQQDGTYQFEMPAYAVTVTAEFEAIPAPTYSGGDESTTSIPANHGYDSVKLKATVSGSNATLKEITDEDLEKLLDGENSDTVVLNFSGLSKSVKSVTIPKKSLEKIEAEMQKEDGKVEGLTINTPNGTILLASDTVTELLKQAEGSTIKFAIESIRESKLTKDQKEAIKKYDKAVFFDIYIESNGKRICTTDLGGFGGEVALMLLPYEMQKGQNQHNCKVFYIAEDGSLENIPAMYNEYGPEFILELEHLSVYAVLYRENAPETCAKDSDCPLHEFSDTDMNAWYHDGVHYSIANGIMKGVGNDLFKPTATISRAEIVTMLWRLAGEPYVDYYMQFKDVKEGEWYSEAVRFAAAEKIVEGYEDGSFMPNKVMTREEVATVLCRFAKYIGQDIDKATEEVNTLSYNDIFDVSEWAKEGMHYCLATDVIEGYEDECIKPQNSLTRAEAATMIYRFCEKVLNK